VRSGNGDVGRVESSRKRARWKGGRFDRAVSIAEPRSDRGVDQGMLEVCCGEKWKRAVGIDVGLCRCGRLG
jgi:hypothetical protein